MKKLIVCAFVLMSAQCWLLGQDNHTTFSIITDQDFFYRISFAKNEDRNYTQGTSIGMSNKDYYTSWLFYPFRVINRKLSVKDEEGAPERRPMMSSVSIIGTAFTPRIIDSINPIVGDRPFAFIFGIHTGQVNQITKADGSTNNYEAFGITYALLGTNLGYNFQGWAHQHIVQGRPTNPKGWNTQISQGGVPTFLFNYERMHTFNVTRNNGLSADGFLNFGGSVGYYDRAYGGAYLRFGWIDHANLVSWAFWGSSLSGADKANIESNDSIRSRTEITGKAKKKVRMELFGFSRFTAQMMARNSLLVGQLWSNRPNEYRLDPAWVKVPGMEMDLGLALALHWDNKKGEERFVKLLYKNTVRSPEFDSKIFAKRWHYFGSAGIQFTIN